MNNIITRGKLQEFIDIHEQIENYLDSIWQDIIKFSYGSRTGSGIPSSKSTIKSWEFWEGHIDIEWEESWRYGGYDSGCLSLEIKYLYNTQDLQKGIVSRQLNEEYEGRLQEELRRKKRKKQYDELKKEFE